MAKTKEQKQKEAWERKYASLPKYRQRIADTLKERTRWLAELSALKPMHPLFARYKREFNIADERHKEAIKSLHRLCVELKCDTHGNPI